MGACHSAAPQAAKPNRPRRIVLVRHGQSRGNVDPTAYATTPDWKLDLTSTGREEARDAGRRLRTMLDKDGQGAEGARSKLFVYCSPYSRCQQTLAEMLIGARIPEAELMAHMQEPRLREQDFGNFQDPDEMALLKDQRGKFGRFFYRFPHGGESGADVYDRVSTWLETLFREMQGPLIDEDTTLLIVTHGITARLFLMRWYHWTVDEFERTANPSNAQLLVMERGADPSSGTAYNLTDESYEAIGIGTTTLASMKLTQRRRQTIIYGSSWLGSDTPPPSTPNASSRRVSRERKPSKEQDVVVTIHDNEAGAGEGQEIPN